MSGLQISVIVPVYNGEKYLGAALESIFSQELPPAEVIAVDDGSTDSSPQILQKFSKIRAFRQPNRGVASARNLGVAQACGNAFAFLDQDDLWLPPKLRLQSEYLLANPDAGYVLAHEKHLWEPEAKPPVWLRKQYWHEPYPGATPGSWLVTKEFFHRVGDFNTNLRFACDGEWILRAQELSPRHYLPETLLLKRLHSSNESQHLSATKAEQMTIIAGHIKRMKEAK